MTQKASGSPQLSFASGANATYIDGLYGQYKQDPTSVDESWQRFFEGYEFAAKGDQSAPVGGGGDSADSAKVEALINAYRRIGHLSSHLNPLEPKNPVSIVDLTPEAHGIGHVSMDQVFHPANLPKQEMALKEVIQLLDETYCGRIGADFRDINDVETVVWLQNHMESVRNKPQFSYDAKRQILERLTRAEGFEQFLGRRYIGQKRFSLEGADTLIPMMNAVVNHAAERGVEETCIGMAHRGRLNVLANILNKSYESMLKEFEGSDYNLFDIDGDVKYHLGYATEVKTPTDKKMRIYLSPNPSHLEAVNPVVEGFTRARQNLLKDADHQKVLPILMHGDASIAGQGIVAETFNLANLEAYKTGGTLHIIINNQVGFTTEPSEHRSSDYSSEISKMVRAPVLHVNADDPEAAVWCAELAVAFRQKFGRDIVIDLIGYRRHGHNEGDEPAFTQPLMYKKIAKHPTVLTQYTEQLVKEGSFTAEECKKVAKDFKDRMQAAYESVHGVANPKIPAPVIPAALQKSMSYHKADRDDVNEPVETGISAKSLKDLAAKLTAIPEGFSVHKKLQRLLEQRQEMVSGKGNVDWGFGELLALASISAEGHHVRFTGQDVARGTFTSRHAVWVDTEDGKRFNSLSKLGDKQGDVHIVNSPLSEQGCLGFEFGYAVADPDALVIWEAQFGDFSNGAQIIIDQFLSASEAKWKQCVSLVMLLPHGHEGQGPEHSSARPERYLQLCGNLNMQVVNSTTPAQHFHVLRRQMHRNFRKPLIVMTPKSLLRAPVCTSELVEFEKGRFHEVLDDKSVKDPKKVERMVICSGKIYYELLKVRDESKEFAQVPLVRLEQLYPFPYNPLKELFKRYANLKEVIWTQEEPQNMGSWHFVLRRFNDILGREQKLSYVGRKNSGTTAEGSGKAHEKEQNRIIEDSLSRAIGKSPEKKTKS